MNRTSLALLLSAVIAGPLAAAPPDAPKTKQVKLNGHTFTLPEGFDIEIAAGPPLIERPVVADFDEQGRLYVAEVAAVTTKESVAKKEPIHRILRLEDSTGSGRFDKKTVFADKMLFPEGCMWYAGSLYVAAPPSIWKLTDTRGTGVADQRVEWFQGKTLTGCANDLHGPYLGPDGWIYWCKGAFAEQSVPRPGKKPMVTKASHIFRCRPDGTGLEAVMTGGMDNPVDVVFTPTGERIFTTTFFQHPGGGQRDGLIHAVYGAVYGKDHAPVYDHPWTAPTLMPPLTHMGPAAPCGLHRLESAAFGKDYQDNLFACQFNMRKVSRHVLTPKGATFACHDEDFLVSENIDFHPTDVLEDADGSLLVIDTGGWYKLCCPTSQLAKPDVAGAIYRIRRTGLPPIKGYDPRGLTADWPKMPAPVLRVMLDDPRPAVRRRAIETLAARGEAAVPELRKVFATKGDRMATAEARRNALWTLVRIATDDARAVIRSALDDEDETVRQVAGHSVSLWRDAGAVDKLREMLRSTSAHNRRIAAEALGRIGNAEAISDLRGQLARMDRWPDPETKKGDIVLEHSLVYALLEIGDTRRMASGFLSESPRVRRASLIVYDQTEGVHIPVAEVVRALSSGDARMVETGVWVASRHPEWGPDLAGFFRERLAAKDLTPADRDDLAKLLARFAKTPSIQVLLAEATKSPANARLPLRAMAQSGLKEMPETWTTSLTQVLAGDDKELLRDAATTVRAVPLPPAKAGKLTAALLVIADNAKLPDDVRLTAFSAVPGGLTTVTPAQLDFMRVRLDTEKPVAVRALVVDVLVKAKLSSDQLVTLTEALKTTGPMEADRLLEAFAKSTDEKVGRALLTALRGSPALAGLHPGALRARLAKYPASVKQQTEELCATLEVDAAKQKEKIEKLLPALKDGDVRRGQRVFTSAKASCMACHAIGYVGGKIAPDLTRIGKIRSERDLLESIVFPSASIAQGYQPILVSLKNGKSHNGLTLKDTPDELVLQTGLNQEVRIPRGDIDTIEPGKVSIMPAGLDQQLTVQELADLVAFLKACQ
jgi:putative membrane-bound dehydrogenase-like protein